MSWVFYKWGDKIVPVPPKLQSLIDEVRQDLKLNKKIEIKPFMSKGSDVKSIGFSLWSPEVYIALPEYYMFDEGDDQSSFTVVVNDKEVLPNAPEFKPLKQAMSLSKEAKKFGIAHEIIESQHSSILPCYIMPMLIVLNCNAMSYLLDRFSKKPVHISNHCVIFLMGAWMYALLFDISSIYRETASDFLVSDLGKSYTEGGIEYYQKMIKRNTIFKKLNKDAPYKEDGDINISLFRTNHMPLHRRIIYLSEIRNGKKESLWDYILYN